MSRNIRRAGVRLVVVILGFILSILSVWTSWAYPGDGLFSYQCGANAITFAYQSSPVITVTLGQIAGPLAAAIATQQNQPVVSGGGASLWALKSNELQIHISTDPDGTKSVLRSDICGTIPTTGYTTTTSTAIAYASGTGQTTAFAAVGPNGEALAFAQVIGQGQAYAFVQVTRHMLAGGRVHVVQRGENLFRIALRYGYTTSVLASANGISNPNLIYVGQVLIIP